MAALTCPLKGGEDNVVTMKMNRFIVLAALSLSACSQEPAGVRVVNDPVASSTSVAAKTEPVYYNGKTYQVSLTPATGDGANVSIAGMGANQAKDASGLATSAFHHFACKDSQKAVLQNSPVFDGGSWKAIGHCV